MNTMNKKMYVDILYGFLSQTAPIGFYKQLSTISIIEKLKLS